MQLPDTPPIDPPSGADITPTDPQADPALGTSSAQPPAETPSTEPSPTNLTEPAPVSQKELNAWRRGFTPQAEIWNGRLAMLGLSVGLTVLLVVRISAHLKGLS